MLPYPLYKIGCDTDVECAIGFAAQQVDGGLFHAALLCLPVWIPAFAGMTVWAMRMTVWALGRIVSAAGMTLCTGELCATAGVTFSQAPTALNFRHKKPARVCFQERHGGCVEQPAGLRVLQRT